MYYIFNNGVDGFLEIEDPLIIEITLPTFNITINQAPQSINNGTQISFTLTSSRNGEVFMVGGPTDNIEEAQTPFFALNSSDNNYIRKNEATTFTTDNPILKYTQVSFKNLFIAVVDKNETKNM